MEYIISLAIIYISYSIIADIFFHIKVKKIEDEEGKSASQRFDELLSMIDIDESKYSILENDYFWGKDSLPNRNYQKIEDILNYLNVEYQEERKLIKKKK